MYIQPSRNISREITKDVERQNINIRVEFSGEILSYLKEQEKYSEKLQDIILDGE